jgi:hypothetical protein
MRGLRPSTGPARCRSRFARLTALAAALALAGCAATGDRPGGAAAALPASLAAGAPSATAASPGIDTPARQEALIVLAITAHEMRRP